MGKTGSIKFGKNTVILLIAFLVTIIAAGYAFFSAPFYGKQLSLLLLFLLGAFALAVLFLCRISLKDTLPAEKIYLFGIIVFSLLFMLLFPPITVPDEQAHFYSAYYFSNFVCCPLKQAGNKWILMRSQDKELFYKFFNEQPATVASFSRYYDILSNFKFSYSGSGYSILKAEPINTCILGYIPSAIAIALCRLLNLGIFPSIYAARLFNMASYWFISYAAMKKLPVGKMLIFGISMLPMTLHSVASISYDGMILALGMLFVSFVLYYMKREEKLKAKELIICTALGIAVAISKVVYLPLIVLIFFLQNKKISQSAVKAVLIKLLMLFVCFAAFGALQFAIVLGKSGVGTAAGDNYTLSWVLSNIWQTVIIFVNTVIKTTPFYLYSMVGGSLGWFQINSSLLLCIPLYALLIVCMLCGKEKTEFTVFERIIYILAMLAVFGFILLSMMFMSTPVGSESILGVQGRYFLPLLVPFLLCIKPSRIAIKDSWFKYIFASTFVFDYIFAAQLLVKILG